MFKQKLLLSDMRKQKRIEERAKWRKRILISIGVVVVLLIAGVVFTFIKPVTVQSAEPIETPAPAQGKIRLDIQTPDAVGNIEGIGIPIGQEMPFPVGVYSLVVSAEGFAPYTQTVEIFTGNTTQIQGALVDSIAPDVVLSVSPSIVTTGDTVQVAFHSADTGSGLTAFHLALDGERFFDSADLAAQNTYDYALPLAGMHAGLHQIELRVIDVMGNTSKAESWVEIDEETLDINGVVLPTPKTD